LALKGVHWNLTVLTQSESKRIGALCRKSDLKFEGVFGNKKIRKIATLKEFVNIQQFCSSRFIDITPVLKFMMGVI